MDHASELEVVPLSSGIDDIDQLHKSHPFVEPPYRPSNNKIVDLQNAIRDKLAHKNSNDSISPKAISEPSKDIDEISNISTTSFNEFIQFPWACQGGYVDPYLRQLGLPDDMMNYAWILGPISGTISLIIYTSYPCTNICNK